MAHVSLITLGVDDLARAVRFYEELGWRRSSASVDGVVAFLSGGTVALALFGRADLAADAAVDVGGTRPCALATNLPSAEAVDGALRTAEAAGAEITRPARRAEWGGYSGYFRDPDGHLWEAAHNPGFPLRADGSVRLPEAATAATSRTLVGDQVVLRPLVPDDLPWLREAAAEPSVARWWHVDGPGWVEDVLADDAVHPYAIEVAGDRIGFAQWYEEDAPGYRHAGIDLLLVAEAQGRGYGRDAVRTLARWLFAERGHHRIGIDPAADNERAVRCYEAVGFRRIGVARRRERAPDGGWRDSLLLDLLADELR